MSDSNRIRVTICQEPIGGAPAMLTLLTTGQAVRDQIGYLQSQTIRNDANIQDLIRMTKAAGGGVPAEFFYPTPGEGLRAAMNASLRATEAIVKTNADPAGITIGGTTVVRGIGSWISDGFEVGDIVRITNASNAADNRFGKVTAVVALTLTLQLGDSAVWAATDADVTVTRGARSKNGTTDREFSVEVARLDVSLFQLFTLQVFDQMAMSIVDGQITTIGFGLVGSTSARTGSPVAGATYPTPAATSVLDAIGVPHFFLGGVSYACKEIGFDSTNNCEARTQIGTLGATSIRRGAFTLTGRVRAYMQTFTEMNAYADNTPSDMWMVLRSAEGKYVSVSCPQFKWTDLAAPTQGLNQDDYLTGAFQAYLDPVEGCTMRVQYWD